MLYTALKFVVSAILCIRGSISLRLPLWTDYRGRNVWPKICKAILSCGNQRSSTDPKVDAMLPRRIVDLYILGFHNRVGVGSSREHRGYACPIVRCDLVQPQVWRTTWQTTILPCLYSTLQAPSARHAFLSTLRGRSSIVAKSCPHRT